ncbi:CARDB domain-containing protein [Methanonatronarchaeum sp. AMET-Sl]|uniref:CARDB domain-containing protein n=1 Tax=Methanonatronarchaeum sp. AMET-Sl TaxID=3037654 RepID=UPI00244DB220|nr:CARDB domain-containing protein [Methanonatronarchaeum sp. AMET-Sl]WGI18008.1 CARDB domain-containing protein [Methanonatronarchaeum sp. AMET-Sl]
MTYRKYIYLFLIVCILILVLLQPVSAEPLSLEEEAYFEVDIVETNSPILEGENFTATIEIKNTGNIDGNQTIELYIGDPVGETVDTAQIQLEPNETKQINLTWETKVNDSGEYDFKVETDNEIEDGGLTVEENDWETYIPDEDEVEIEIIKHNNTDKEEIYVESEVTITFSDLGYRVVDWDEPTKENNTFTVNTEIEKDTGLSSPAVKTVNNTYSLGELEEGEYQFKFMSSNEEVETKEFTIPIDEEIPGFKALVALISLITAVSIIALQNRKNRG